MRLFKNFSIQVIGAESLYKLLGKQLIQGLFILVTSISVFMGCNPKEYDLQESIFLKTIVDSSSSDSIEKMENASSANRGRRDLDPHAFRSISEFAHELKNELNRILTIIPPLNAKYDTSLFFTQTKYFHFTNSDFVDLTNRIPWFFCLERKSKEPFNCFTGAYLHSFSDIRFQDAIIQFALNKAIGSIPECNNGNYSNYLLTMKFEIMSQRFICNGDFKKDCFNAEMYVKANYLCHKSSY